MSQQFFNRPPRLQPELPQGEIDVPNPPDVSGNTGWLSLLTLGLPLITILGYSFVVSRGGNILMLIPMGIASVITSTVGYLTWKQNRQRDEQKQEQYRQLLQKFREQIKEAHTQQQAFYKHNSPDMDAILRMAQAVDQRLWERRLDDADFGMGRLGKGRLLSTVQLKLQGNITQNAPLLIDAQRLVEDSQYVQDVSISLSMRELGAVGVASKQRDVSSDVVRALLVHMTAMHAPNELRVFIVSSHQNQKDWNWARWLPHCNSARNSQGVGEHLCFDANRVPQFWENIQRELEDRQNRLEDSESQSSLPMIFVVVDMWGVAKREEIIAESAVAALLSRGPALGASILFIVPDTKEIPGECRAVVEVEGSGNTAYFRYSEVGINAIRRNGIADVISAKRAEDEFARYLAPLTIRTTYGADLPVSLTMLDLLGIQTIDGYIQKQWKKNLQPGENWPEVVMGRVAGDKPYSLIFEQNKSGVHGLIAGTTGTGKSQLLMSLVIGLAIHYDPSTVNFVLVDYKGGTAFEALRKLPHTVDVITNLQGQSGVRAFTAIRAELNRRSALLTQSRVQDIGQYYAQGYHLQEPLSHLFIIIDEFAEMVRDKPEFKVQLESIARLGRAVGVHLLLATQRPSGVVSDQIQANMKFRICLRVESADDSRELLGRADATFLPANIPGRAYFQVGKQDLNLVQVAQVAAPYQGPQINTQPPVIWLDRQKSQSEIDRDEYDSSRSESFLDLIVRLTEHIAHEDATIRLPMKPWPDPLPEVLTLGEIHDSAGDWFDQQGVWNGIDWSRNGMHTVIGKVDHPAAAIQELYTLDLTRGHAVVFGISGWGKTSLLQTIIFGLAAEHSPEELQMYFLDFGGRGLDVFRELPHLGATITSAESERVQRLFRRLEAQLDERKMLLSQAQTATLAEFNVQHPERVVPAILLVIDNFAEFRETFIDLMESSFTSLMRDGRAYGIHVVCSAEQVTTIPPKIYNLFSERIALRLADLAEYSGVVGRGVSEIPDVPGRGFIRPDRIPLEFQVALPKPRVDEKSDEGDGDISRLSRIVEAMKAKWAGTLPEQIRILPAVVPLKTLKPDINSSLFTIGQRDLDLEPATIDLRNRGPHFTIIGPPLSGKTTAMRSWLLAKALTISTESVAFVLVDFQRRFFQYGGAHHLGEIPHVLRTVSDMAELDQTIQDLSALFTDLRNAKQSGNSVLVMIDNYDDFASVLNTNRSMYTRLADLGRQFSNDGLHFITAGLVNSIRTNDELMRQIVASRYGLGLDDSDSVMALGGRLKRGSSVELPTGRGYLVKSGLVELIQVATPQVEGEDMEQSLDTWVEYLINTTGQKEK